MKTKWQPFYCYEWCGLNLAYVRYDDKTGLYDFKTQKIIRGNYSEDSFILKFNQQEILDRLRGKL